MIEGTQTLLRGYSTQISSRFEQDNATIWTSWTVKGPRGATSFTLFSHIEEDPTTIKVMFNSVFGNVLREIAGNMLIDTPGGVGYHSRRPRNEWQRLQGPNHESCELLDGAACYHDASGVAGMEMYRLWRDHGRQALYSALEENYRQIFG